MGSERAKKKRLKNDGGVGFFWGFAFFWWILQAYRVYTMRAPRVLAAMSYTIQYPT